MSVITLGKFTNRNRDLLNKLTSLDYVEKVKDKENTYVIDYSKIDDKMWNEYRDYVYERGVRRVVDGEIERRDLTPEEKEKLPFHYFTGNKGEKNVVFARNYDSGQCDTFCNFLSKALPDELIKYDIRTEGYIDGFGYLKDCELCDSEGVPIVGRLDGFSKDELMYREDGSVVVALPVQSGDSYMTSDLVVNKNDVVRLLDRPNGYSVYIRTEGDIRVDFPDGYGDISCEDLYDVYRYGRDAKNETIRRAFEAEELYIDDKDNNFELE